MVICSNKIVIKTKSTIRYDFYLLDKILIVFDFDAITPATYALFTCFSLLVPPLLYGLIKVTLQLVFANSKPSRHPMKVNSFLFQKKYCR